MDETKKKIDSEGFHTGFINRLPAASNIRYVFELIDSASTMEVVDRQLLISTLADVYNDVFSEYADDIQVDSRLTMAVTDKDMESTGVGDVAIETVNSLISDIKLEEIQKIFLDYVDTNDVSDEEENEEAPITTAIRDILQNALHEIEAKYNVNLLRSEDLEFLVTLTSDEGKDVSKRIEERISNFWILRGKVSSSINVEINAIKSQMRNVDHEVKRSLSSQLRKLEDVQRNVKKIFDGVNDIYNMPVYIRNGIATPLEETRDRLIIPAKCSELKIRLDCRPSAELDRDPGIVSGDCTEGSPLPFGVKMGFIM